MNAHYLPPRLAWRAVIILTTLYLFGTLDRQILSLLAPAIKADLELTDIQLSMLQGSAFGLFYIAASLPVGWLIDSMSRRRILFWGAVTWSAGSILSGLSRSFGTLFASRALVGAGEATINPSTYTMMGDIFPPERLTLPINIYVLGGNLGGGISFVLGGAILLWQQGIAVHLPYFGLLAGWQVAFLISGAVSFAVGSLVWAIPEPRRRTDRAGQAGGQGSFPQMWRHYRDNGRFYLFHHLGIGLLNALFIGLQSWNPSLLSRKFGWSLSEIGLALGLVQIVVPLVGLAVHGWAVDRLFRRRKDAHMLYLAVLALCSLPPTVYAYVTNDPVQMLLGFGAGYFCFMGYAGIGPAALQIATPAAIRGKASSVYLILFNLIGAVLGPLLVALLTDLLFSHEGQLDKAMAVFSAATLILAIICFAIARAPMRRAIAKLDCLPT